MRKRSSLALSLLASVLALSLSVGCSAPAQSGSASSAASTMSSASADASSTTSATSDSNGSDAAVASSSSAGAATEEQGTYAAAWAKRDGLTLKKVVAVSRHNMRAPLSTTGSAIGDLTTHQWVDWTSEGSELTVKGGTAETIMGQFFRKWLEDEGLFPANYIPEEGAVRIYANPRQRTLSTATYFSAGLLPVGNTQVEYHGEYDSRDPVFKPRFTYVSDTYATAATDELAANGGKDGIAGLGGDLQQSYDLIMDVLDFKNSPGFKNGDYAELKAGDTKLSAIELDKEPKLEGSIDLANQLSDALILQYYQAPDAVTAAFGKELTWDQWLQIAAPRNEYGDLRYDSDLVSVDCAHLLVEEVRSELGKEGRRFTFMCGHDSNLMSLLHALGVKHYELPDTLELQTPIGGKILFELWEGKDGTQYANIRYVYATSEQVRDLDLLSLSQAPASFDLEFESIQRQENGLFLLKDVEALFDGKIELYNNLPTAYPQSVEETELAQAA